STMWAEVVALCPPSSSEAVPVPIGVFKKWMADDLAADETADVEGGAPEESEYDLEETQPRPALRWRGPDKSERITAPKDVTPNDTYVVRVPPESDARTRRALRQLADVDEELRDYGDQAFQRSRDKAVLRFTPAAVAAWPKAF